jgi:TolB-like protein
MRRAVACALAAALLLLATPSEAEPRVRVALLPVVVHSIEQSEYLQRGIGDMLGTRLEQNPALSVVRVQDPAQATLDPEAARRAAQAAGAAYAVFGSFTQFGEGASLDLRCVPVQGGSDAPRAVFVQAGTVGEIIPQLDDVADRLARHVVSPAAAAPPVAAGPASTGARPPAAPALKGDVDALRARVERLESLVLGRDAARPAPPPAPAPRP